MIFKKKHSERRAFERANCYCLVQYKIFDQKGVYEKVVTSLRNISDGGMLLKFKEQHLLGTRLEVKINLPLSEGCVITAVAEVVRTIAYDKTKDYWAGIKFIDIKEEDKKKIKEFINFIKKTENGTKH